MVGYQLPLFDPAANSPGRHAQMLRHLGHGVEADPVASLMSWRIDPKLVTVWVVLTGVIAGFCCSSLCHRSSFRSVVMGRATRHPAGTGLAATEGPCKCFQRSW